MPRLRLTSAAVERLKPPAAGQVEYFDTQIPSFGLRISYSGARAWFVTTRIDGKLTRLTLGRYPILGLADAREKSRDVIALAQSGRDPRQVEVERERERQKEKRTTFSLIVADFMARHVERQVRPSTAREYRRYLKDRIRPIGLIARSDPLARPISLKC